MKLRRRKLEWLPEVTQLVSGRAWAQSVVLVIPGSLAFHAATQRNLQTPQIPEGPMRYREGPEKLSSTSWAAFLPPTTLLVPTENVADSSGGQASSRKNYHGKLIQQKNIWCKSMTVNPRISLFVLNFWPTAARPTTEYQEGTLTRF